MTMQITGIQRIQETTSMRQMRKLGPEVQYSIITQGSTELDPYQDMNEEAVQLRWSPREGI